MSLNGRISRADGSFRLLRGVSLSLGGVEIYSIDSDFLYMYDELTRTHYWSRLEHFRTGSRFHDRTKAFLLCTNRPEYFLPWEMREHILSFLPIDSISRSSSPGGSRIEEVDEEPLLLEE